MYSKYILELLIVGLIPMVNGEDAVESTRAGNGGGCKTKSEKHTSHEDEKTNTTCVFPFYFKRFKYTKCTNIEEGFFWCSTKVDADTHDHIGGNWGTCNDDCPKAEACPYNVRTMTSEPCPDGEFCNWSSYCQKTVPGPGHTDWRSGHAFGAVRFSPGFFYSGQWRSTLVEKDLGRADSPELCRKKAIKYKKSGYNGVIYGGSDHKDKTLSSKLCYAVKGMTGVDEKQITWISSYL